MASISKEAIPLWKKTKYWFLYPNPSRYMSSASDASCSIIFLNYEVVNQFKGCMYCCINQPLKDVFVIAPSLDSYIFQRLHLDPKMVGIWQGSSPFRDI
jgi:hypothetical protein